jgi:metal-responsive CopG/Arc/MetJ family transcriptional regulator
MAESKVVSIRIPQELLSAIDRLAAVRYPSRRGGEPNRSQLILDLIESGIQTASDDTVGNRITVPSEVLEAQFEAFVDDKLSPIQEKLAALESELEKLSA